MEIKITECYKCHQTHECLPVGENRAFICPTCFGNLPVDAIHAAKRFMDEQTAEMLNAELKRQNITMHIIPLDITEEGFLKSMMSARDRMTFNQFMSAFADISVIIVNVLPKLREDLAAALAFAIANRTPETKRFELPENPTREDMIKAIATDAALDLSPCTCPLCRRAKTAHAHYH